MESKPRQQLRRALNDRAQWPLISPGIFGAGAARLAGAAGFPMLIVSGFGVSAMMLGRADAGYLTLTELAYAVSQITKVTSTPVLVDADTGFGNALGVMRTVEELTCAGASALFFEDQVAPKKCGHMAGKMVVPAEEFAGKIRAAHHVRQQLDPDLILVARSDSRGAVGGSLEELLHRGKMYRDAGADVFFPEGLTSTEELEVCGKEVGLPMLYNMAGFSPRLPAEALAKLNVFIVALPGIFLQSAFKGLYDALNEIAKNGLEAAWRLEDALGDHPVTMIQKFVGFPEIRKLEEEYLPTAELLARYESNTVGYRFDSSEEKR
jgi:2-methylisocitrate lyase-like PEP mutase family enzyme